MGIDQHMTEDNEQHIPRFKNYATVEEQIDEGDLTFSDECLDCCIGVVDIVNSTKISAALPESKLGKYYGIFLNGMRHIVKDFGAQVVKNVGDSILYYFPDTNNPAKKFGFMKCLECSLAMTEAHREINDMLCEKNIPLLDYRVSADFGRVSLARSCNSLIADIFGPPVNICTKINCKAQPNNVVIGGDLHRIVRDFCDYKFVEVKGFSVGFRYQYPVYSVLRRKI